MTAEQRQTSGWKQKVIHEITEYWINFLFLAVVFFSFTCYRRLILDEYHVHYLHYGFAIIQAAVLAKVILIGEAAGAGRKYENKPLIIPTLYKTVLFAVWVVGFKVFEHMTDGLVRGKGLAGGVHEIVSEGWYEILANGLVVITAFVPFFAIKQLGRALGRETLVALFFRRRAGGGSDLPHG